MQTTSRTDNTGMQFSTEAQLYPNITKRTQVPTVKTLAYAGCEPGIFGFQVLVMVTATPSVHSHSITSNEQQYLNIHGYLGSPKATPPWSCLESVESHITIKAL
jgi:hypothetical protein